MAFGECLWKCAVRYRVGARLVLGGETPTQLDQIINSSLAARYVLAALAVFTAPLVEELIYRGVLYSALQRLVGVSPAVIVVLAIFTLIHVPQYWPNVAVISAVGFLSVCLTIIRAYTGAGLASSHLVSTEFRPSVVFSLTSQLHSHANTCECALSLGDC